MSAPTKWSPEPWEAVVNDEPGPFCGSIMLRRWHEWLDEWHIIARFTDDGGANGRRAAACVSACAGMADPAAEVAALRECERAAAEGGPR